MKGKDDITESRIIKGMVGREIADRFPKREPKIGEVLMEVKNWTVHHPLYSDRKVVDNVNLNVKKGEVVGISGLMGAGRTELAMSLFGKSYGSNISGELYINGKKVQLNTVQEAIKNHLAYVTEDRKGNGLILSNPIKINTTLANLDAISRHTVIDKDKEYNVADTPEKMDKYIKTIYNKAIDMDRLINELTTYSGIDNNRIPYNFHRINVADYFGDCVEEVGLDLEQRGIKLNYSNLVSPDTVVIADPEQMKKVINNIISNSVKYMDKPDGHIDIRILDEVDSIRVEIEDNGKGIAQKDLQKIFERFYRTDASRNSAQGGSGIGLSIVKKIVEDHGGYVWATAKEGEGTCMHFVLRKYIELQPGGTK